MTCASETPNVDVLYCCARLGGATVFVKKNGRWRCGNAVNAGRGRAEVIERTGEDLEGLGRGLCLEDALKQIAATAACHAAVNAHYPLTLEKMHHILDKLRATAYSTVCPHGRPVMLRITRREIEKNVDRI